MADIIFINSHPIQYFAPLYKYLNENGLKTEVWYGSNENVMGSLDKEFGVQVKWDVPLLEGYEYHFFKNNSWKPSYYNGFFGLLSFSMIKRLSQINKSVIIVHGYHYASHFLTLLIAKLFGHTVCLRNDIPYNHEKYKASWLSRLRKFSLKYFLLPRVNYFLYIGEQNRLLYKSYGIADKRLIFCPYAVDNGRFKESYEKLQPTTKDIKERLGVDLNDKVILFSAKYIEKKRPLDLLKAFNALNRKDCWLIMLGEGNLRKEMEQYIIANKLDKVILTGFVNQSEIVEYYTVADIFVMCSGIGENWGLSVNEAMNFDVPIVLSDLTGSAYDLVKEGVNGYMFKTGDVPELTEKIDAVLSGKLSWEESSQQIVDRYSYRTILEQLRPLTQ